MPTNGFLNARLAVSLISDTAGDIAIRETFATEDLSSVVVVPAVLSTLNCEVEGVAGSAV